MDVSLLPDLEKLAEEKVAQGEFSDINELVNDAVQRLMETAAPSPSPTPEERLRGLQELFDDVDRDLNSDAPPLSDEALRRESLYDDSRHRL